MLNILKNKTLLIVSSILLLLAVSSVAVPMATYAQKAKESVRCGSNIDLSEPSTSCAKVEGSTSLNKLIKDIINIFSAVVGAVCVIMIIVGGFRYITSGGDSNNVGAAKNTILYAIVGLILVAVAQIIVQFVLERTTS